MKEIAIISGKGGTGKTSITASLAYLAKDKAIVADCDVDAADMHLLFAPDFANASKFYSGKMAKVNPELCIGCDKCKSICRFDAIAVNASAYQINEMNCEGCGYCATICPVDAITMNDSLTGELYISTTRLNNVLVHAELNIGAENSGKLVSKVRKVAKQLAVNNEIPYVIIDGTPGIGCPVIASITGVSYVVVVTEPTISGVHDLYRVYQLIERFGIKSGCIINKSDLNEDMTEKIKTYLNENNIDLISELPYDNIFTEAITSGKTVVEFDEGGVIESKLIDCWAMIQQNVN
ncbi:MAG: ATP-binding protein [Bacteroidales bacterium]|nr:ATP-binding protein [Bacteroidales bacterium]